MPKDKTASHAKIMVAISEEFFEKGFENASIRGIAARAGMSSAGLYRHYKDKEDMFLALVQPLVEQIYQWVEEHKKHQYALLDQNAERDMLLGQSFVDLIKEIIIPNKNEFKLLICYAKGTRYENFMHDFVAAQQDELIKAIRYMKECGYPAKEPLEEEIHLLLSAYASAIFEPIIHDYSEEKTMRCLNTCNEFFMPGWMKIMGL